MVTSVTDTLHIHGTLLRKSEVAEILSCTMRDIDRHWEEWGLRKIHLGKDPRSLRFFAEDVAAFIQRRMEAEAMRRSMEAQSA